MTWSTDGGWTLNHRGQHNFIPGGTCHRCGQSFADTVGFCTGSSDAPVLHADVVTVDYVGCEDTDCEEVHLAPVRLDPVTLDYVPCDGVRSVDLVGTATTEPLFDWPLGA